MCEPEPAVKLSEREAAALVALAAYDAPMQGGNLASKMRAAGRETSSAAAHQAGASLARKGLAVKGIPDMRLHVQYEITNQGRDWVARYRSISGHANLPDPPRGLVKMAGRCAASALPRRAEL